MQVFHFFKCNAKGQCGSRLRISILLNNQRDAALSSRLYYSLWNYSTCFGCSLHPSSEVH